MSASIRNTIIAGRYRVESLIGEGGMGRVWRVQHVQSLERYALKVLNPEVAAKPDALDRFMKEARVSVAIKSRHLVRVYDVDTDYVDDEGVPSPYVVMELLDGESLEKLLRRLDILAAPQVIWMLQQAARVLDQVHENGIVHRDLKPENLFIAFDDEDNLVTKVCDFGIAKLLEPKAEELQGRWMKTSEDLAIGTPLYMAPEQAKGVVVRETDQWAIALIAFRSLCGLEYFSDATSTASLIAAIAYEPLPTPSLRNPKLPPEFDAWFLKSCARNPGERWLSVAEQIEALRAALQVTEPCPPQVNRSTNDVAVSAPPPPSLSTIEVGGRSSITDGTKRKLAISLVLLGVVAIGVLIALAIPLRESHARQDNSTSTAATSASPSLVDSAKSTQIAPSSIADHVAGGESALPLLATPSAINAPAASSSPAPSKNLPPVHGHTPFSKSSATTATSASAPPASNPTKLGPGAACSRSSACQSGYCVAEHCL